MRVFLIPSGTHQGKQIHVTKYVANADGVSIQISHNIVAKAGLDIQWVQSLSSNHGNSELCKLMTRVDPFGLGGPVNTVALPAVPGLCKADDLLPFYWTAADLARRGDTDLADSPSDPAPATGRTWKNFVTALTEVTGTTVHHLVAISWGYDRMADGTIRVNAIHTATTHEMAAHGRALKQMYPGYRYN